MKQLTFNLPESSSRTQTHIVTIPKLKEILSSVTNTGNVTVKKIEGEKVTIEVTGGSYSRYEQRGSYTPGDSKTISMYPGYTETRKEYYRKQGSSWVFWKWVTDPAPSSYVYNVDGYSGTLSSTATTTLVTSESYPLPPTTEGFSEGEGNLTQYVVRSVMYRGTVTKPAVDNTYYIYYYKYNVTINYEEKGFNLQVKKDGALKLANQGWVKIGGALRPIEKMQVKKDGTLREV